MNGIMQVEGRGFRIIRNAVGVVIIEDGIHAVWKDAEEVREAVEYCSHLLTGDLVIRTEPAVSVAADDTVLCRPGYVFAIISNVVAIGEGVST
ncbi:MAG: hypothetical protein PHC92_05390 [Syntrophomonadaceae bacterium]|nr:hypothetical protein [Syntrophomonadaceae bacterium]